MGIEEDYEPEDNEEIFENSKSESASNDTANIAPQDAEFYKKRRCIKLDNLVAIPDGCRNSATEWIKNIDELFGSVDCENEIGDSKFVGKAFVYKTEDNIDKEVKDSLIEGRLMADVNSGDPLFYFFTKLFSLEKVFKYAIFVPIGGDSTEVPKYFQFKGTYVVNKVRSAIEHRYILNKDGDEYKFQ